MDISIAALITAASEVGAMGDKVAAFAIGQNLLWVLASLKGDLGAWVKTRRGYFIAGSIAAVVVYIAIEGLLAWHSGKLIRAAYNDDGVRSAILSSSQLLFSMRAAGAAASAMLAALAFWGTTRPDRLA